MWHTAVKFHPPAGAERDSSPPDGRLPRPMAAILPGPLVPEQGGVIHSGAEQPFPQRNKNKFERRKWASVLNSCCSCQFFTSLKSAEIKKRRFGHVMTSTQTHGAARVQWNTSVSNRGQKGRLLQKRNAESEAEVWPAERRGVWDPQERGVRLQSDRWGVQVLTEQVSVMNGLMSQKAFFYTLFCIYLEVTQLLSNNVVYLAVWATFKASEKSEFPWFIFASIRSNQQMALFHHVTFSGCGLAKQWDHILKSNNTEEAV